MANRSTAPVFVMGSPRSGTTLFYHMLLSAGDFAIYRTEAHVFNMLAPKFGDLGERANKEKLLAAWLPSEHFRRSGLTEEEIRGPILERCRNAGDFLRILMETTSRKQGVRRWAECTPENVLYLQEIKRTIPDALFIHMIRDGRDVAVSMARQGWVPKLPVDTNGGELAAGCYWEWLVERGRANLRPHAADAIEVRYEDLLADPQKELGRVGAFIEHDLDYARIQQAGVGSVSEPNTSFAGESRQGGFNPVGRWKSLSLEALARLECAIGGTLRHLSYELASTPEQRAAVGSVAMLRGLYRSRFSGRHFLKAHTPLGRLLTSTALLKDFRAFDQERLQPKSAEK